MSQRGPSPARGHVSWTWFLLLLCLVGLLPITAFLDFQGVIDVYPKSAHSYVCAVCGRYRGVEQGFLLSRTTYHDSPGTKYSDRFIGEHKHVWVETSSSSSGGWRARQGGESSGDIVPIATCRVPPALKTLEGTEYLEPVIKALCDVDNYYAYLARDVLCYNSDVLQVDHPPTPEQVDRWWQEYEGVFVVEHEAPRALPLIRQTAKGEGPIPGSQETAQWMLWLYDRFGVTNLGAVVKHGLGDN